MSIEKKDYQAPAIVPTEERLHQPEFVVAEAELQVEQLTKKWDGVLRKQTRVIIRDFLGLGLQKMPESKRRVLRSTIEEYLAGKDLNEIIQNFTHEYSSAFWIQFVGESLWDPEWTDDDWENYDPQQYAGIKTIKHPIEEDLLDATSNEVGRKLYIRNTLADIRLAALCYHLIYDKDPREFIKKQLARSLGIMARQFDVTIPTNFRFVLGKGDKGIDMINEVADSIPPYAFERALLEDEVLPKIPDEIRERMPHINEKLRSRISAQESKEVRESVGKRIGLRKEIVKNDLVKFFSDHQNLDELTDQLLGAVNGEFTAGREIDILIRG